MNSFSKVGSDVTKVALNENRHLNKFRNTLYLISLKEVLSNLSPSEDFPIQYVNKLLPWSAILTSKDKLIFPAPKIKQCYSEPGAVMSN